MQGIIGKIKQRNMKKLLSFLAVAGLMIAACTKEQTGPTQSAEAVTGTATNISCRNARISGKANISGTSSKDLSVGVLYSTSSEVLVGTATQIAASSFDSDYNYAIYTEVLEPETTYYYRSFITKDKETFYGETKSFKTLAQSSMIQTSDATDIHSKNAVLNAMLDLTNCKYKNIEYGFELTPEGGSARKIMASNHSDKKFSVKDVTLAIDTKYSLAAYVQLDGQTYKAEPKTFSTTPLPAGAVDLGLSVLWHQCNIGATKPEDSGRYFGWGDAVGQTWDGSKWSGSGFYTYPSYQLDENHNLKPEYDAAHVILGDSWRMPTRAEQQELMDNCTATRTKVSGVAGMLFTSTKPGYTDKNIFLPTAGVGVKDYLDEICTGGYYWCRTFYNDMQARCLAWDEEKDVYSAAGPNSLGITIRPVSD